ncbi:fimbrial protein, partial [Escherichia coli]|uniref:fimbrial protein n=1 Tax=Escherichia coli TaxID=562 RepID=UPI000A50ECF6
MIKITPHKIAILMGILLSPSVFATDINVEFTATVKATTCNITLTGNNVTNDGNNNYTLRIPKMGLDKIANKTTESQADFKLVASGCSSGISWIDTTLTGNASSSSPKLIIPQSGDSSSTTSNIGMGFKKRTTDDATGFARDTPRMRTRVPTRPCSSSDASSRADLCAFQYMSASCCAS